MLGQGGSRGLSSVLRGRSPLVRPAAEVAEAARRSGERSSTVEPAPALHVVGDVGERDAGLGANKTDRAHDKAHHALLVAEAVLDASPHGGLPRVGPGMVLRHRLAARLPAMDPTDLADVRQMCNVRRRAVGRVCPHVRGRIPRVDQPFAQLRAVMGRRIAHPLAADDPVPAVDPDVALGAERRHCDVDLR